MDGTDFGRRVKAEREARHWTQAQLAGASGTAERTVRRVENGEPFSKETLLSLCAVLDLKSSDFAGAAAGRPSAMPEPEDPRHAERLGALSGALGRAMPDAVLSAPDTGAHAAALFGGSGEAAYRDRVAAWVEPRPGWYILFCATALVACTVSLSFSLLVAIVHPWEASGFAAATVAAGLWPAKGYLDFLWAERRYLEAGPARARLGELDRERRSAFALSARGVAVARIGADAAVDVTSHTTAGATGVAVRRHREGSHVTVTCMLDGERGPWTLVLPWLPATPDVLTFAERLREACAARAATA